MEFQLPQLNIWLMSPEIFLFLWALVVFAVDLGTKRRTATLVPYLAMFGILVAGVLLATVGYGRGFGNMFVQNPTSVFFKIIFLGAAFMAIGSSFGMLKQKIINHRGEFFGLLLFSTIGMMFLASSNELLSLYIGLELTTIPLFVLAAFFKDDRLSVESGVKYLIMGAFSSALLLYGLSFLYGLSGTTDLLQMKVNIAITHLTFRDIGVIMIIANITLLAGLGFKLALPPFHQWAPDVYEGAPTSVAAFLSVGSKAASLIAFAKIFIYGLSAFWGPEMLPNDWGSLLAVTASAAMIYGNVVAIRQSNIKRMLAYSSIAQAGYIMIGMLAMTEHGMSSVAFYIFAYMFANMGAFACVAVFEDLTGSCQIHSYRGLARTSPMLSILLMVFLLSLAGIPPLAGFLAKYYVFFAAIQQAGNGQGWLYWVVGIGLVTSVFAFYYYANIIKQMFFSKEESPYRVVFSPPAMTVLMISLIGVILFGLYPSPVMEFAGMISRDFGFLIN